MIEIPREVTLVRRPVLAISAAAWMALAAAPASFRMHVHCPAMGNETASLSMLLGMNPLSAIAGGWALMVVAMMAPLTIPAIHHVRFSSFARRRGRSIALFTAGYGAVWMACGALFTGAAFAAAAWAPRSYVPAAAVALIACVWQASPWKQRCLNGCHDTRAIAVFGRKADLDALRFGWTHGVWCAGGCCGLMLFAMLLPAGHLAAMAAVAVVTFCERLEGPEAPRWKMRGLGKAARMAVARGRVRVRMWRGDVAVVS